jgi:hypothetical protein
MVSEPTIQQASGAVCIRNDNRLWQLSLVYLPPGLIHPEAAPQLRQERLRVGKASGAPPKV